MPDIGRTDTAVALLRINRKMRGIGRLPLHARAIIIRVKRAVGLHRTERNRPSRPRTEEYNGLEDISSRACCSIRAAKSSSSWAMASREACSISAAVPGIGADGSPEIVEEEEETAEAVAVETAVCVEAAVAVRAAEAGADADAASAARAGSFCAGRKPPAHAGAPWSLPPRRRTRAFPKNCRKPDAYWPQWLWKASFAGRILHP